MPDDPRRRAERVTPFGTYCWISHRGHGVCGRHHWHSGRDPGFVVEARDRADKDVHMTATLGAGGGPEWTPVSSVANPWGEIPIFLDDARVSPRVEQYMARVREVSARRDCVSHRHHYVAQAYLRAWSPDGKRVRALHMRTGADRFQSVKDTCVSEGFYRVTDEDGQQHHQVEAMLAVIDDEAATMLDYFRRWEFGDDVEFDHFMSLAVVTAFQANRTPQQRRLIEEWAMWQSARVGQPATGITTELHVDTLFRSVYRAADQFTTRQLELWDDPRGRFITSDQPVMMSDEGNEPPSMMTSHYVWWPISPTRMVAFSRDLTGKKVEHRVLSRRDVSRVRTTVIRNAESIIVALPDDEDLPAGRVLPRRPQLRVDCEPVDLARRECRLRFGRGYGARQLDFACRPLCALRDAPT